MGIYSHAELIYGIPVTNVDNPELWDDEAEDWLEPEYGELTIIRYGHYEDPDAIRGILTTTRVEAFRADCWEPVRISEFDLSVSDKAQSKSNDQLRVAGLGHYNFYSDAGWYLVASVG